MRSFLLLLAMMPALEAQGAELRERRYALVVGANRGEAGETELLYAVEDANRLGQVLVTLGGFVSEDLVLLADPTADRLREAMGRLNARIRADQIEGSRSLLLVFYSGHADALSLHLGGTRFPWEELRNLVAGSSATTRLLVADACRSGQATRVKGFRPDDPFALTSADAAANEGFAIVSSATAGEAAQESEEIRGSFFTHHFLAALRGIADANRDGNVTLQEAYQYTSDRTIASTAATLAGVQHPTYLYELKGRGDVIVTRPTQGSGVAEVRIASPGQYFFRESGREGALALEANVGKKAVSAWLHPARYFVQRRTSERFYEGWIDVRAGTEATDFDSIPLEKIEYDQLVRKGGTSSATSLALFGSGGTPFLSGFSLPVGAALTTSLDTSVLTIDLAGSFTTSFNRSPKISTRLYGAGLAAGVRKVFDIGLFSLSGGVRVGALYFHQSYGGDRIAPDRRRVVPHLDTIVRADIHVASAWFVGIEGALRVMYLSEQTALGVADSRAAVQGTVALGIGVLF